MGWKQFSKISMGHQHGKLVEKDMARDPLDQFSLWLDHAVDAQCPMPNAMTLATVDADGKPDARIVLLMKADTHGLAFFTNYHSAKGRQLEGQPYATVLFFWPLLERQVKVCGLTEKTTDQESSDYFATRPRAAQIAANASTQSEVIENYTLLTRAADTIAHKFSDDEPIPRPKFWGGYRLHPDRYEFWQGGPHRLHDRIQYRINSGGQWQTERLAP